MGKQFVQGQLAGDELRAFMTCLLKDLQALERMESEGWIEEGVRRVGAEQELFLVDSHWRPAPAAMEILEKVDDPHATNELGLFNLELNLDPVLFGGNCLSRMENELQQLLDRVREKAAEKGLDIVLAGILPTIRKSDLDLSMMTPKPRYHALNEAVCKMRGRAHEFHIKGLDEILLTHDSVMVEACNASFQVHFQVGAKEFPNLYNICQVASAPVLAAAANSPLLFGRRLWRETRIALFQQAVDTRTSSHHLREATPRVTFGRHFIKKSVLEVFREDVARFRALVGCEGVEDPLEMIERGEVPQLKALQLYNGTIYRWNRACYGITDGKPHLRIENRVLPSGPSVVDEVANAAFWFGLISYMASRYQDITEVMEFADAKLNFLSAARLGLEAQFTWLEGKKLPAQALICEHLLPQAMEGLEHRGIDAADCKRYLEILDQRVRSGNTGAQWQLRSLSSMRGKSRPGEQLNALTAALITRQKEGKPVGEWRRALAQEAGDWDPKVLQVEQYMSTDLITVREDESVNLVASMMVWKHIRHVPVEDQDHRLVGLISYRSLLRAMANGWDGKDPVSISAGDIMKKNPICATTEMTTLEAIYLMQNNRIDCLPVCREDRLVGILTERDFMDISAKLLQQTFQGPA